MRVILEKGSGARHMRRDVDNFSECEAGAPGPVLSVYQWEPQCISIGYSQKTDAEIDAGKAQRLGWDIVNRPTGGGIVFHNIHEVTYSLVMPIDALPGGLIPSYIKISEVIVEVLKRIGIAAEIQSSRSKAQNNLQVQNQKSQLCFSYPAEYEIVHNGKKLVGSAQKRGKRALLQQGSIFVARIPDEAFSVLKREHDVIDAVSIEEVLGRIPCVEEISSALIEGFKAFYE